MNRRNFMKAVGATGLSLGFGTASTTSGLPP
ncbi:twin-arginine translocation signal domain-containing protein [Halothiobacillus sp.]